MVSKVYEINDKENWMMRDKAIKSTKSDKESDKIGQKNNEIEYLKHNKEWMKKIFYRK